MPASSHEITWRHDFDAALRDATTQRAVLLDFSAAPM
jgi:hypothetical protein